MALVITNYVMTLIPLKVRTAINLVSEPGTTALVIKPIIVSIFVLAAILALSRAFSRIMIFLPGRFIEFDLRNDLYSHLLKLSNTFYRQEKVGDLMSRLTNDIQALRLTAALGFLHLVNTTMIYGFVIYQMTKISPQLTLYILIPIPIVLFMVRTFVKKLYIHISENQKMLGRITNFFVESLGSIRIIKSFVAEKPILDVFEDYNESFLRTNIRMAAIRASMFPFIGIIGSIGQLILFLVGGRAIIAGTLSVGDFVAFSAYIVLIAWPTASLSWIINIIQRGRVSLKRLNTILETVPDIQDSKNVDRTLTMDAAPEIEFKNLSFKFDSAAESPTLNDISFKIEAGTSVGIFGPIGSGKSTIANLMARLETVEKGQFLVDGRDVHDWPLHALREATAYVSQTPFLFSSLISENIQYAERIELDAEERSKIMTDCVVKASVLTDIERFPEGFDTLIGERGVILSGGQKTRVALARALYKPHRLLILDDVLSAVDHETEKSLIHNLQTFKEPVTRVIISHRVSALTQCEKIIVLNQGEITASGTHDELIKIPGIYQKTWAYQQLESASE
ncbi:MAG: ATP-binding cassette subfamily B multidrug efflux pump [Candidatus Marinamargulisbacteria bacterium]|jgi:ATP-binding cassette subfamily B multidrug efflux pump